MSSLEALKQELLTQRSLIESKGGTVEVAHTNPSPSEITAGINTIQAPNMTLATATEENVLEGKTFYFRTYTKPSAAALYFPTTVTTTSPVTGAVSQYGILISAAAIASVVSGFSFKKSKEN